MFHLHTACTCAFLSPRNATDCPHVCLITCGSIFCVVSFQLDHLICRDTISIQKVCAMCSTLFDIQPRQHISQLQAMGMRLQLSQVFSHGHRFQTQVSLPIKNRSNHKHASTHTSMYLNWLPSTVLSCMLYLCCCFVIHTISAVIGLKIPQPPRPESTRYRHCVCASFPLQIKGMALPCICICWMPESWLGTVSDGTGGDRRRISEDLCLHLSLCSPMQVWCTSFVAFDERTTGTCLAPFRASEEV